MAHVIQTAHKEQERTWMRSIVYAFAGSLFLAAMSQLSVYLPLSPVPMTMQTLAIFLLAGFQGSRVAAMSVIAYLVEGSAGLPVFAGGEIAPLWFLGCRAGFLISFVAASFAIGKLLEKRKDSSWFYIALSLILGDAIIYSLGWAWLSLFFGPIVALSIGVVPFLVGSVVKIISGTCILKGYQLSSRLCNLTSKDLSKN